MRLNIISQEHHKAFMIFLGFRPHTAAFTSHQ